MLPTHPRGVRPWPSEDKELCRPCLYPRRSSACATATSTTSSAPGSSVTAGPCSGRRHWMTGGVLPEAGRRSRRSSRSDGLGGRRTPDGRDPAGRARGIMVPAAPRHPAVLLALLTDEEPDREARPYAANLVRPPQGPPARLRRRAPPARARTQQHARGWCAGHSLLCLGAVRGARGSLLETHPPAGEHGSRRPAHRLGRWRPGSESRPGPSRLAQLPPEPAPRSWRVQRGRLERDRTAPASR